MADLVEVELTLNGEENPRILGCYGDAVSVGQIAAIFIEYVENHPEHHDEPASAVLVNAMNEAFPCEEDDHG